jgi:tetratricopeptide (TPR) repeat protein
MRKVLNHQNLIFSLALFLIILSFTEPLFVPRDTTRVQISYWILPRWLRLSLACPFLIAMILITLRDRLYKHLEEYKNVVKIKRTSDVLYFLLIVFIVTNFAVLVFQLVGLIRTGNIHLSDLFRSKIPDLSGIALLYVYLFLEQKELLSYFRIHKPSTVVAAHFNQQHINYFNSGDFQKAHDFLLKACQAEPAAIELWSQLAFLCEMVLHDSTRADRYIQEIETILESGKKATAKEIACYENYLGYILCNRGRNYEGLEHIRKAIELDPDPDRIVKYDEKLSEIIGGNKIEE